MLYLELSPSCMLITFFGICVGVTPDRERSVVQITVAQRRFPAENRTRDQLLHMHARTGLT
jgi:hypothetical protein